MSGFALRLSAVPGTIAWLAMLAACDLGPLSFGNICGPDDPPGADCDGSPPRPPTQNALLVLELRQQGLPDPRTVYYHFLTVDLDSGDTLQNQYIAADTDSTTEWYEPGRYGVDYLGLAQCESCLAPADVACTLDRPRRAISLAAGDTARTAFVFQCAAR